MGFRRVRLVLAAAALGTLFATSSAKAEPSAGDRETARSLMQEARELRDKGHLQDALKRFKAADDLMRVPTTGLELARTQAAMGLLLEARDTIANIRKMPSSPSDPEPFKDARAKMEELDNTLESKIPALTIVVQGAGPGETPTVVVDGAPLAAAVTGLPRRVNTGRHTVVVKTATMQGEQTVDVKEGEQKEVQVTLTAANNAQATPSEGEQTPAQPEHPGEPSGPTSHSPTVLTFVGIGVGGAGIIAGAITGLLSMSKTSSLKSECLAGNHCTSGHGLSDYNSAGTLATISDIGFIAGGVGAAVAVVSLIIGHPASTAPAGESTPESQPSPAAADSPAPQSSLRVVPWIGFGSAGVNGVF